MVVFAQNSIQNEDVFFSLLSDFASPRVLRLTFSSASLPVTIALLHVAYPKDSRCSLQTQLRRIFRLLFHAAEIFFGVKDQAKNPPELRLQATRVQLYAVSLNKFPEENNYVLVDVTLSNGLIDTGFAPLICCPTALSSKKSASPPPPPLSA